MNKIEYDDGYRFRRNPNFIESDGFNLHIKLRITFWRHFYDRSDFKSELLQNRVSEFEFQELLVKIENSVNNFFIIRVLLLVIYFSIFFFILFVPIFCLILAFCFEEDQNIDPIFITLVSSILFGFVFLVILKVLYIITLKNYDKTIKSVLLKQNQEKFFKKNVIWTLGRNCIFLRANMFENGGTIAQGLSLFYEPPNEFIPLSVSGDQISENKESSLI